MFNLIKNLLDFNKREIDRINKIVGQINDLEDEVRDYQDKDFKEKTLELKKEVRSGKKTLDDILPISFALVREAARRTLGQRHYDVQLLAAVAMHEGKVVEQKTGEGKTLTATAALYLNGLLGKGAHLVTVNDYLARRDAGWMGQVFDFLGLTTSAIISGESLQYDAKYNDKESGDARLAHLRPISRKVAYEADITYGINSEFGFDYLRDNMANSTDRIVQRDFYFAIVDEADSVLIDEARTPHIMSAPYEQDTSRYYDYAKIVKKLSKEDEDYVVDEKLKTAHLTEKGIEKVEKILGVDNVYEKDFDTLFYIEAALKAQALFEKDKDYIVNNGEVVIVDEFTGRLLEGRRFSQGLHQAIEAKENVQIKKESRTLATVSLQNYFRMYEKLAGMTGTASTEAEEFNKIYGTDVLVIPTNRPIQRKDEPDFIFKTLKGKYKAVVEDIATQYKAGRPVLVGTTSIDKNEYLSRLLNQRGIPHELLNAKNHEREANIISSAGKKHAVTVATNMAGRGVDIVLGGEIEKSSFKKSSDYKKALKKVEEEQKEVIELGGLYVIGTERHESRRIDNQLRGRSGRQGDPGETRFYVSLEDDVMRIFGGEQISNLMTRLNYPEDQPISHGMVSKAIEQAQVKVEGFNFDIRKNLVEYDDVLNRQRDIIYSLRKKALLLPEEDPKEFKNTIFRVIKEQVAEMAAGFFAIKDSSEDARTQFEKDIETIFDVNKKDVEDAIDEEDQLELQDILFENAKKSYNKKEKKASVDLWNQIVRSIFLGTIDQFWTEHLTAIDDLRQGINLRGYAQLDPLVEYKNEAFSMFEKLLGSINYEATRALMKLQIEGSPQEEVREMKDANKKPENITLNAASAVDPYSKEPKKMSGTRAMKQQSPKKTSSFSDKKLEVNKKRNIGRNDLCWCGSGKKWKKCHYPE